MQAFNDNEIRLAAERLTAAANQLMNKSFSAGTPGAANAERTGLAAFALEDLSKQMESIALQDEDFLLTKNIKTVAAKGSLHEYNVKTAAGVDVDVWTTENGLPQESSANYRRVAEVLKVMGIRKSASHMAQTINSVGGYAIDIELENEENALLTLNNSLERALYSGGDGFIDANGNVDTNISARYDGPIREIRGIQCQIREGVNAARAISQDFIGYANNRPTVIDAQGSTLTRGNIDQVCAAVSSNRGQITEIHVTPDQARLFRSTLFPMERANVGSSYSVRGSDISAINKKAFACDTIGGTVDIISTVFKNDQRAYAVPAQGSAGAAPIAPTSVSVTVEDGNLNSPFKAGDVLKYVIQAQNLCGRSYPSVEFTATLAKDGQRVSLSIPFAAAVPGGMGVERFNVFRLENGDVTQTVSGISNHRFVGTVIAERSGATTFKDNGAIRPGLAAVVFLPRQDRRVELATIGPRVSKINFGVRGLANEVGYVSYVAGLLKLPRQHGLLANVLEEFPSIT